MVNHAVYAFDVEVGALDRPHRRARRHWKQAALRGCGFNNAPGNNFPALDCNPFAVILKNDRRPASQIF